MHLRYPGAATQLDQLLAPVAADLLLRTGIDIVNRHPRRRHESLIPILRDLRDLLITSAGQLDSTTPELRPLGSSR